jgi:uracil-DNA glycosylase family 4
MRKASPLEAIEASVISCGRCPELRAYAARIAVEKRRAYAEWEYWGKPVPAFGDARARLMLVGLAPGAHGSNRTGRPFTGDASGEFLYGALHRAGFASSPEARDRHDGLQLRDCVITAALHCAPPQNRPTPAQLRNCFPHLMAEFDALARVRVVVALGAIGFTAALRVLRERGFACEPPSPRFAHGAQLEATLGRRRIAVLASYHPSRQNTNTGKLTASMFDAVFSRARRLLESAADEGRSTAGRAPATAPPSSGRARPGSLERR